MSDELDKVCRTLDKLLLDSLTLMEEEIQLKLNVEKAMCGGESHLAKSRYIMGQNNVSALQLPSEHSEEIEASLTVISEEDKKLFGEKSFVLQQTKPSEKEGGGNIQNPIKWFGILVPQNLHYAQNMYRQALQWIVKAANVQTQLIQTCKQMQKLKAYKAQLVNEREE